MELFTTQALLNLFTLTGLEIILGIDNVIFIALLVQHLEPKRRNKARIMGLSLALIMRVLMLLGATWIMKLTDPLFHLFSFPMSGRSLLLIFGGLFLVIKTILEIKEMFHPDDNQHQNNAQKESRYLKIISQIIFIDIILSFDSIITAVGISDNFVIMVIAIVIAMIVMIVASKSIGDFIYNNPSIKVVALAFIGFLGLILVLAGFDIEINKAYLYFSMLFAGIVEVINIKLRKIKVVN
ncbi:MAG: TerC family protein [Rickettsiales bacterium]